MIHRTNLSHWIFGSIALILVGCNLDVNRIVIELPAEVAEAPAQNAPQSAEPTATILPEPIPVASATETPTPIPTPAPRPATEQIQLTQGGCCVEPGFSADSHTVWFIDKPAAQAPVGMYGVNLSTFISPAASPPQLVDEIIGFRPSDQTVVAYPEPTNGSLMRFVDRFTNETWTIDTLGNWPIFSPDGSYIYWNATEQQGPYDERPTDIWVAKVDGSEARRVLTLYGGGANGWFPDNERLLISGRDTAIGEVETMTVLSLKDGSRLDLAQDKRLRSGTISPNGAWVVYLNTFSDDEANDGIWAVRADGLTRRKLPFFGPYQWRTDDTLVYIPPRPSAEVGFAFWQINVETGDTIPLTDAATLPLKIAGGDWALSPDGQKVVYVSANDHNLWLIDLPRN